MFISFNKMFDMLSDIDSHENQITELKQAVKKLQSDKDNNPQAGKPDIVVNMSRATAGLTLLTIQVFDQNDELVNVIIKDGDVDTFGTREDK